MSLGEDEKSVSLFSISRIVNSFGGSAQAEIVGTETMDEGSSVMSSASKPMEETKSISNAAAPATAWFAGR
jgi:hypothetical protein